MLNSKKYLVEFGSCMFLYSVAVIGSVSFLIRNPDASGKVWISLMPVVPASMAVIAVLRGLSRLDELQQQIQLRSFATSFAIVGLSTFSYGFLENVGFPHIPYVWIFPFMITVWGICTPIIARRFQ